MRRRSFATSSCSKKSVIVVVLLLLGTIFLTAGLLTEFLVKPQIEPSIVDSIVVDSKVNLRSV